MLSEEDYHKRGLTREIVREYLGRIAWRRAKRLEQRGNFDEKFPEDALTAFLVMGNQYFDGEILRARKLELTGYQPINTFSNGQAKIFNARVANRRYVIGADPKKGIEVSTESTDFAAAVVLDVEQGEEMAAYRARVTATDLAYDLADLGRYYNNALIAVERVDGGATILTLNGECKYPSIYRHREWWRRERQLKMKDYEAFPTTPKTRPVALDFLNRFIMEHPELIWDEQFINEALTFVRNEKGVPSAAPGAYDDTVSCRWIAHYVRQVLLGYWAPEQKRSEGYVSADRLTDLTSR